MKNLVIILSMAMCNVALSQTAFRIDERKILLNENLDYFITSLKTEQFKELSGKEKIPKFISEQLPWINDKSIANKNEEYQATDVVMDETLPWRRLIFLCKNDHIFVATYVKGGIGTNYKILFVKFKDNKVLDIWIGTTFCHNLNSIKEILDCIGTNRKKGMGLNTNLVDE